MSPADPESVIVSAGFAKTHVTTAAAEASARGTLSVCVTGAYPTPRIRRTARALRLSERGRVARLFERGERIPAERVRSQLVPELLYDASRVLARVPLLRRPHGAICAATWRLYGRRTGQLLRRIPSTRILHYRAGFGQSSVDRAKELGGVALCDYALAHPSLLGELIANRGRIRSDLEEARAPGDPLGKAILADIDAADVLVLNSDFVKETFLAVGWRPDRLNVVYLGVDDNFLDLVPPAPGEIPMGRIRLLFAGLLDRRKGAEELIEAVSGLADVDWELRIAGPVAPEIRASHAGFLDDDRTTLLGVLSRPDLAREMRQAHVFVFPSLAEGSARVVFEALACGCYVITTPNSGTIVRDGVHGRVVPPGDPLALREAIAATDSKRSELAEVGDRNARLIRESYTQSAYGDRLDALYQQLLAAG